jgi:predicted membrane GTPase involved in stress response
MMGFRHEVLSATRGNATINSMFCKYDKVDPTTFSGLKKGKLVSMDGGKATGL